jgi:mono/diheme cytochrome c family protein
MSSIDSDRGDARQREIGPTTGDGTATGGTDSGFEASAALVLGLFASADALVAAIAAVRPRNLGRLEAYTPYPVHGLDEALGQRRSPLGGMVTIMAVVGALTALGGQYWISAIDFPIVTGGKAPWSWEAFVPIMFEVTVLFATFTAGLAMLFFLNKLPFFGHPVLGSKAIAAITRDRFALSLEADVAGAPALDVEAARLALASAGADTVEVVPAPVAEPIFTSAFILRSLLAIVIACGVSGFVMYWAIKLFPVAPPMSQMLDQARLDPQRPSGFFRDGHGMQRPAPGTVARGYLGFGSLSQDEAKALVNPLPRDRATLALGREKFSERCAVCHGPLANGDGSLTAAYGAKPANLQAEQFRNYADGQIFWVITRGKNAMPSHAADLTPDQRWAVVHYLRALQRAQNARDEDLMPSRKAPQDDRLH